MNKNESLKTIKPEEIEPGMVIRVHQKIKELNSKGEEKERIQVYEGLVIKHRGGSENGATFTVRKISEGIGVEKIFPLHLPSITKIELVKQYQVRRAKLYYVRGNPKKLKDLVVAKPADQEKTKVTAKAA